jgi:hypothetical protein
MGIALAGYFLGTSAAFAGPQNMNRISQRDRNFREHQSFAVEHRSFTATISD